MNAQVWAKHQELINCTDNGGLGGCDDEIYIYIYIYIYRERERESGKSVLSALLDDGDD